MFIMENPIEMDDLIWGYPYFRKPPFIGYANGIGVVLGPWIWILDFGF
jgi:hypothetical protein